jgi:hypothetical protein
LGPQANYQSGRTTNDQKSANDFAPTNIALFHKGLEYFGKRAAWLPRNYFLLLKDEGRANDYFRFA